MVDGNKARIYILIGSGLLLIIVGVLALFTTSDKSESAGFAFIGLGNLLLGISRKETSQSGRKKSIEYASAAASLIGLTLIVLYWLRIFA